MGIELISKIVNLWWKDYQISFAEFGTPNTAMFYFSEMLKKTFAGTPINFTYNMKDDTWEAK